MTNPTNSPITDPGEPDNNSTSQRASWCESSTPVGSTTLASPAPGVAGADQHRGALDRGDAAEGGPHPIGETHPCHNPHCVAHSTLSQPNARNRTRNTRAEKRTHLIASRFNDAEKNDLLAAAAACSMTPSGFLAHAALHAARDLDRTAAEVAGEREMIAALFALRRRLGQISNNVNQVAKALNAGADVPYTQSVLDAVHRSARHVDDFTQRYLGTGTWAG
ncbi:plasmid mobilization protein [Streptomyces yangpuensis]|uniref:plasmid mobilization protein n=1 Tax=Streptomyces yangpuensis TaxID=1648182 RepID=UPI003F4D64FB